MAEGLNVDQWAESSPAYEIAGQGDYEAMDSLDAYGEPTSSELYSMGTLPAFFDIQQGPLGDVPDLATTAAASKKKRLPKKGEKRHPSHLLDFKSSSLSWLGIALILYFGLIAVQLHARVGVR